MDTKHIISRVTDERLTPGRIVVLALLPGLLATLCAWLLAPWMATLGAPTLLARFLGNALFIGLFELGYLLIQGKRATGACSLNALVAYRQRLPWWQIALWVVLLLAWGLGMSMILSPMGVTLRDGAFAWMPAVFRADPVALDPAAYSRGAMVATVLIGLLFTGVVIPVAEELYYRGYLLPRMAWLGWLAPALNVLLWGLDHFFEPWNIPLFVLTFLPVGLVAYWKKNVTIGIVAHVLANLMAVLPMLAWLA